jgi:zinc/manganese transport system substrate-binding protein
MRILTCLGILWLAGHPVDADALRVFACEPEWAALATELGGERIDAYSAVTGLQDVHMVQARPSLIAKYRRADLVICTGADLESGWLPLLLRQGGNPRAQPGKPGFIEAARHVQMLEKPVSLDRAQGDLHAMGNPHIQTDPRNIAAVATVLAERLALVDPDGAAEYRARASAFLARWDAATQSWQEKATAVSGMTIVTHHRSWVYLANWLRLSDVGSLEPKPGIEPSASHLASLLDVIKQREVSLIVRSAYQSPRASEWLSERTGIPAVVLPHTVGSVQGADDLFAMFDILVELLLEASQ